MTYKENQIFIGKYPPEAAEWCNKSEKYYIDEIEQENGKRRFQIKKIVIPEKTPQEKIDDFKNQLDEIDTKKVRPTSAIALNIATEDDYTKLKELETQAQSIRQEIQLLQSS